MDREKVIQGFIDLQNALQDKVKDAEADIHTLVTFLPRACGIASVLYDKISGRHTADQELKDVINKVHSVFGAPGDWGYGTPLGAALKKYISAKTPRPPCTPWLNKKEELMKKIWNFFCAIFIAAWLAVVIVRNDRNPDLSDDDKLMTGN